MAIQERELPTLPEPLRMTREEFLAWDGASYAEWVDGEVIIMSVTDRHDAIVAWLRALLQLWVEERDLGVMKGEPFGMNMAQTPAIREPDVFYIANSNTSKRERTYLDGPADLVVEVVSKESRTRDRREKRTEYERHGVPEYWIIDYEREQAIFLQLHAEGQYREILPDDTGVYHCRALSGLWLQVSWFWQTPLPKLNAIQRTWGLI